MSKLNLPTQPFPNTSRAYVVVFIGYIVIMLASSLTIGVLSYILSTDYYLPEMAFSNRFENAFTYSLCPGDVLYFNLHWNMRHSETVVRVYENWYDLDHQDIIYFLGPTYTIFSDNPEHMTLVSKVVPSLSPGHYEYRRAIDYLKSGTSVVRVSFEISPTCSPSVLPTPRTSR